MPRRPTPTEVLRARQMGVCAWCRYPTEGLTGEMCPECGHHLRAALGPRDPGTPSRARLGMLFAVVLIMAVALVQQLGGSSLAGHAAQPGAIEAPSTQFEFMARMFVKIEKAFPSPDLKLSTLRNLDSLASREEDKLRVAMVAGEIRDAEAAKARLDNLEGSLTPDSPLVEDLRTLRAIYAGETPGAEAVKGLEERHGYFGKLAATRGLADSDPARRKLVGGGQGILLLLALVGFVILLAFVSGFILLIVGVVQFTSGSLRPAFVPPAPGGSGAIEIVAVFALGFLLLKGAIAIADSALTAEQAMWFGLLGQWALMAVFFWPRLMGAPKGRGMALFGWHKGAGVLKEIGCGVVGYLACLPLLLGGAIISVFLMLVYTAIRTAMSGQAPPPPENPVLDIASGKAGLWVVVTVYLLATLWAPTVEETVFRGGLYRHLRSRWHWMGAALVTALGFGVMHAYPPLMMGPVIALGFGFALLREWRGSLIASMTAHCIHNAAVLGMLLVVMRLVNA